MPTARLSSVFPTRTIPGGRITLIGSGMAGADGAVPRVTVGGHPARVTFASPSTISVIVEGQEGGRLPVRVQGLDDEVMVDVGVSIATGLHQVDNPVVDASNSLYLTYSGSRGQQVPVSIFRVRPNGTRESFSSAITNPTSMVLAPDGTLFVTSRFEGAVYKVGDDGAAEVYATDLGIACGLALRADGTLFVGDRSGTVFQVDQRGQATMFATLPSSVAAFHLALAPDGLFVTAPTLSARDVVYHVSWDGVPSVHADGFGRPQGLGVAPDGSLHVVEALAGSAGLYRLVDPKRPELVLSAPRLIGFAFDANGALVACTGDTAYRFPI